MSALAGKRIVVTRADEQAEELCSRLAAHGAVAVRCPTIRIAPPPSFEAIDDALSRLETYDWVVFTSANGVRVVLARLAEAGVPASGLSARSVAAVGRATARALADHGVRVEYVPDQEGAKSLGDSLPSVEGSRILLALGEKADPILEKVLRGRGARSVDRVTAYRTIPMPPDDSALAELRRGVDAVTFTSPSTVAGFVSMGPQWRSLVGGAIVATIGPATTAAARANGLEVTSEARDRSTTGMIEALVSAFARGTRGDERGR